MYVPVGEVILKYFDIVMSLFSSPGQSPGRSIVLPPVLAAAVALANVKVFTLKFFM